MCRKSAPLVKPSASFGDRFATRNIPSSGLLLDQIRHLAIVREHDAFEAVLNGIDDVVEIERAATVEVSDSQYDRLRDRIHVACELRKRRGENLVAPRAALFMASRLARYGRRNYDELERQLHGLSISDGPVPRANTGQTRDVVIAVAVSPAHRAARVG